MRVEAVIFLAACVLAIQADDSCDVITEGFTINWEDNTIKYDNDSILDTSGIDVTLSFVNAISASMDVNEPDVKYINATQIDDTTIRMRTTEAFQNDYEQDHASDPPDEQHFLKVFFHLECSANHVLALSLYINDTNGVPVFEKTSYEYTMPMPLAPNIDLTAYGDEIVVRDVDLTNNDVTFTLEGNDNFTVEPKQLGDKRFQAILKTQNYKAYSEDITFNLTAKDSGNPPLTSTTTIKIKKDDSASLPESPAFESPIYEFMYSIDGSLVSTNGSQINVITEDSSRTSVSLSDETYFTVDYDRDTDVVTLSHTGEGLVITEDPVMALTLTVSCEGIGNGDSTVLISVPFEAEVPRFDAANYVGNYFDVNPDIVILAEKITTTPKENVTVTIEKNDAASPYSDNFNIVGSNDSWIVNVTKELSAGDLDKNNMLFFTLLATDTGTNEVGRGTLIITLPKPLEPIKFTKTYYSASYQIILDDLDLLQMDETIDITVASSLNRIVTIDPSSPYADKFEILPQTDVSTSFGISLLEDLDDTVLTEEVDIVLILVASANADEDRVALVINLPKVVSPAAFTQSYYEADYTILTGNPSHELSLDPKIELKGDSDETIVSLYTTELDEYFELSTSSPYDLTLKKNLNSEDLAKHEILLTVEGSVEGSTLKTVATIVVKIQDVRLKFKKATYVGSYIEDAGSWSVQLEDEFIETEDAGAGVTVTAAAPYDTKFEFKDEGNQQYSVNVQDPLDSDVLSEIEIYITLIVQDGLSLNQNTATLVLRMPEKTSTIIPQFSEYYYEATYTETPAAVTLNGPKVQIIGDQADVKVIGDYAVNFKATFRGDSWELDVIENLDISSLDAVDVIVTLEASLIDSSETGTAVVVVTWELESSSPVPVFDSPFYTAQYKVNPGTDNDEVLVDGTGIDVSGATTVVVGDEYHENFDIACDNGKCSLSVIKDLDTVELTKTEIVIVLKASNTGTSDIGNAAVIITLPQENAAETLEFSQAVYVANYPDLIPDPLIQIQRYSNVDGITLNWDGEYKENFYLSQNGDHWDISSSNLGQAVLDQEVSFQLTLTASKSDALPAVSVLVIQIPKQGEAPTSISFEHIGYLATYLDDQPLSVEVPIITLGDSDSSATIVLLGDYNDSFSLDYTNQQVTITQTDNLPSDVVSNEAVITLTLQATKDSESAEATLIIELPKTRFFFEQSSYSANYSLIDHNILIDSDIVLTGDYSQVDVELEGDHADLFDNSLSQDKVVVSLKNPLDSSIVDSEVAIIVDIVATRDSERSTTALIVNLPKKTITGEFNFVDVTYTAYYEINDDGPSLDVQKEILLEGSYEGVSLSLSGQYANYFSVTGSANPVNVTATNALDSSIIDTEAAITLTIVATEDEETEKATLVVNLPKKVETFHFVNVAYTADYEIRDNIPNLKIREDIRLEGSYDDASLSLSGQYASYFSVSNSKIPVNVIATNVLDSNIIDTEAAIYLTIVATKGDERETATLVVNLPKQCSDDNSGLIVAVAVLSVLLVAALVGSAVFYFLKFRRTNNYNEMDETRSQFTGSTITKRGY